MGVVDPSASIPASPAPRAMTPQEAVATLLIAGARADGSVSPHEANIIDLEIEGMRLFPHCSQEALQSLYGNVIARLRRHGSESAVAAAAASIPNSLRQAVFAKIVDLLLTDLRNPPDERRFADRLQRLLDIDKHTAAMVQHRKHLPYRRGGHGRTVTP